MKGTLKYFTLALILLLVALSRLVTWKAVFVGEGVLPYDTDPYYRLRQIQLIAHHFPHATPEDRYALGVDKNTDPTLQRSEPWLHPSMFLTAWVLTGFSNNDNALRKAAMFVPVIWAVVTALLAFVFGHLLCGTFAGLFAAIFAGFCMPVLWRTSLGALDNHMTEGAVFLFVLLIPLLIQRSAARGVLPLLLGLLLGVGSMLSYWAVLAAFLLCVSHSVSLVLFARGDAGKGGDLYGQVNALGTVLLLAGVLNVLFANVQPGAAFCILGAYLGAQSLVWRFLPRARLPIWVFVVLAGIGGAWALLPGLFGKVFTTVCFVLHWSRDPSAEEMMYSVVNETKPIRVLDLFRTYSLLVWLSPIFVLTLAWQALKQRDLTKSAIVLAFIALLFASVWNRRFSNMAGAVMAPLVGLGLDGAASFIAHRFLPKDKGRAFEYAAKTALVVLMLVGFEPYVMANTQIRMSRGPSVDESLQEAFAWMKANTPPLDDLWNPTKEPPYRVMAPWQVGWWILDLAQRVPVANNAGEGAMQEMDYFFRAAPDTAMEILKKQNARYVLASSPGGKGTLAFKILRVLPSATFANPTEPESENAIFSQYLQTMHAGLYRADGSWREEADREFQALKNYRLLFESNKVIDTPYGSFAGAKLFEVVPGATVTGIVGPDLPVTATLELETNARRHFTYTEKCMSDVQGRFSMVLPYPSGSRSGETKPADKWVLHYDDQHVPFDAPAEAVTEGKTINLGDFTQK